MKKRYLLLQIPTHRKQDERTTLKNRSLIMIKERKEEAALNPNQETGNKCLARFQNCCRIAAVPPFLHFLNEFSSLSSPLCAGCPVGGQTNTLFQFIGF